MRTLALSLLALLPLATSQSSRAGARATLPTAASFGKLRLAFEPRESGPRQWYLARANNYSIAVHNGSAVFSAGASKIKVRFAGAREVAGTAGDELPGKINYVDGSDPKHWRIGMPTYATVTYRDIYPGIDVVYRGNQGQLEFDLILRPRADDGRIRMRFTGAQRLSIADDGDLLVHHSQGSLRIHLPTIYQTIHGVRKPVQGQYALLPNAEVAFRLQAYDRSESLIIDPAIVYTYSLGNGSGSTYSQAIAVDGSGNAYIAGGTGAEGLSTANAPYPVGSQTGNSGFVSKIDPTGATLLYSTYISGMGAGYFTSLALDFAGDIWVAGYSSSAQFPLVNPYQSTLSEGTTAAVVLELGPTGVPIFSTFLGANVEASGIAVDPAGNAYVAGWMLEGTVPTTSGAYSAAPGEGFVSKFTVAGGLAYSTYLCGEALAISVDSKGSAYVTGSSDNINCPAVPAGGAQTKYGGRGDAYAAKLNPSGSALLYFTFLGGSLTDSGNAIAVDGNGNAYIAGSTASPDFPVTRGAFQTVFGGATDGFIAELNSTGSSFQYVTYLGSNRDESVTGIAIDANGNAYVTGTTDSANFPTVAPIDAGLVGNTNSLYRTADGGSSWVPMDNTIPGAVTSVSPDSTPGVLVAATTAGIYRSADSGQTWTQTSTSTSASLSRSPANSSVIYGIDDEFNLSRSTDGGQTFGYVGMTYEPQLQLAADPANTDIVYAYDNFYDVAPERFISQQRTVLDEYLPCYGINSFVIASDGTVYVDFYGCGVYKGNNKSPSPGLAWTNANFGLPPDTVYYGLAVAPNSPSLLYKSNFSNPVYVTTDGGANWAPTGTPPAPLGPLAVSTNSPSTVYAAALAGPNAIYVTHDGGTTWTPAGSGLGAATVSQILLDPSNNSGAYALAGVSGVAFVTAINSTGSGLIYSTYLGSTGLYGGNGIALSNGDAIVTGAGFSPVPPTTVAVQRPFFDEDAITVRISQASAACTVGVSPGSQTVYGVAATVLFQILAPGGCAWTASSDSAWATITQDASGTGSSVLFAAVSPNITGSSRTANIMIGDQTVSILQGDSSCSYSPNTASGIVGAAGGVLQINLTAGAGCPWTVVNTNPTISVTSATSGSGSETVTVSVAPTAWQYTHSFGISIANTSLSFSQLTPCNIAQNLTVTTTDVQKILNEALGIAQAVDNLNHDGIVNVADLQIVLLSALGQGCITP
jgi:hypothetical protein